MAKTILTNGTPIENWKLKDGAKRREISNIRVAVERLLGNPDLNIKPTDLLDVCSIPRGKMIQVIRDRNGFSKKEAEEEFNETLGDLLTESQNSPSLKREKE